MRKQGYTEEEIEDMLKCDQEIDRGADLFPLSAELEQGAKKARRADRTDTPKKAVREHKPNVDKIRLVEFLKNALENEINLSLTDTDYIGTTVEIVNPEREFLFTYNGTKYKVVLSVPRGQ
jgi:hypothetical protein